MTLAPLGYWYSYYFPVERGDHDLFVLLRDLAHRRPHAHCLSIAAGASRWPRHYQNDGSNPHHVMTVSPASPHTPRPRRKVRRTMPRVWRMELYKNPSMINNGYQNRLRVTRLHLDVPRKRLTARELGRRDRLGPRTVPLWLNGSTRTWRPSTTHQ